MTRSYSTGHSLLVTFSLLLVQSFNCPDAAPAKQHAVLVTGASSGIGRNIAETLAADGYFGY